MNAPAEPEPTRSPTDAQARVESASALYLEVAVRCLTSRLSLLAIAVLLANDHLLKARYPSWLTGKLSDFAGLYFAPFLVLVALLLPFWLAARGASASPQQRPARAYAPMDLLVAATFVATGVAFAAVKASPETARPVLRFAETVAGTAFALVADPTDLLALGILPIAYIRWKRQLSAQWSLDASAVAATPGQFDAALRRAGQLLVLAVATLAAVATSIAPVVTEVRVVGIAADPQSPNVLYVTKGEYRCSTGSNAGVPATRTNPDSVGLARTVDGGDSWQLVGAGGERVLPDPLRPGVFYLPRLDSLWRIDDAHFVPRRIWPPSDVVPEVMPGRDGFGIPTEVPAWQAGMIYVGSLGSVSRTADAGANWTVLPLPGSPVTYVTALASASSQPGRLFAAEGPQLLRSEDYGDTWTTLAVLSNPPAVLAVHPRNPDLILAGAVGALSRSVDGGLTWQTSWSTSAISSTVSAVVFDPVDEGVVYAAVRGVGLLASGDDGASWQERFALDARDVALPPSPNHRLYVTARTKSGEEAVYRQRGFLRWPWLSEWELASRGLGVISPSNLDERLVNVLSYLAVLSGIIVLARLLNPRPFRRFLGTHAWDLALAPWALVPALVIARALWSRQTGDELTDTLMVAAVAAPGLVYILTRVRLTWITAGLAMVPALLILAATVLLDESWLPFGVGLVPFALAAAALLLRASRPRLARIALVLATIAGNGVFLAFLALDFMFRNAFPGCVG